MSPESDGCRDRAPFSVPNITDKCPNCGAPRQERPDQIQYVTLISMQGSQGGRQRLFFECGGEARAPIEYAKFDAKRKAMPQILTFACECGTIHDAVELREYRQMGYNVISIDWTCEKCGVRNRGHVPKEPPQE